MGRKLIASGILGDYPIEFVMRGENGEILAEISKTRDKTRYIRYVDERDGTRHFSPWRRYMGDVTALEKVG